MSEAHAFVGPKYSDRTCSAEDAGKRLHQEYQDEKLVTVYGVTDRNLDKNGNPILDKNGNYVPAENGHVQYYVARVPVRGSGQHFEKEGAPIEMHMISQEEFDKDVEKQSTAGGTAPKLGIYTHGALQNVDDVAQKAAEISADSNETIVIEDWDTGRERQTSKDTQMPGTWEAIKTFKANYSQETTDKSDRMITESVNHLSERFGSENIDLIAHSHGSTYMLDYLSGEKRYTYRSVTFSHPDFPGDRFVDELPNVLPKAHNFNIAYDPQDHMLKLLEVCNITNSVFNPFKWSLDIPAGLGDSDFQNNLHRKYHSYQPTFKRGYSPVPSSEPYFQTYQDTERDGSSRDQNRHDIHSDRTAEFLRQVNQNQPQTETAQDKRKDVYRLA